MPSNTHYDLIILGAGGVGSFAMVAAARRGLRVLAIDRHDPPHTFGSSHGQTRIIRQAYFEHPDYVPLLKRAYQLWAELEEQAEQRLYFPCGLLQVAPHDGAVRRGILASAAAHNLSIEEMSAADTMDRYGGFVVEEDYVGLYEQSAGYLLVEDCVRQQLRLAQAAGAELLTETIVQCWQAEQHEVRVETHDGTVYSAAKLIIAAGPWAAPLLQGIGVSLQLRRRPQFWFEANSEVYCAERGCPAYLFELPDGIFYGFPQIDSLGVKVAEHSGGNVVDDPEKMDRRASPQELHNVESFLERCLPQVTRQVNHSQVCCYTMTPDEHFLLGLHPAHSNVAVAAGLSGHGFKFTPVLGEALVDLATEGRSDLPIEFLRIDRPMSDTGGEQH